MRFAGLHQAWLLLLLGGLFLVVHRGERRGRQELATFARDGLLAILIAPADTRRQGLKRVLRWSGLLLCLVALLRPQGGVVAEERRSRGIDIVVALDVSHSMLVRDVPPSRLEVAKGAIRGLVAALEGDRVGLVVFAGTAFLACPLTSDYPAFLRVLESATGETLPRAGTSLANPVAESVRALQGKAERGRVLILVSDGEAHEGDAAVAVRTAQAAGIKVFTVGVGTAAGGLVPGAEGGGGSFHKDRRGSPVISRLERTALQELARAGGGEAQLLTGPGEPLAGLYRSSLARLPQGELRDGERRRHREWFQLPLGFGILLLGVELLLADRRRKQ
jgi:Ca-activated chloride channel family protein